MRFYNNHNQVKGNFVKKLLYYSKMEKKLFNNFAVFLQCASMTSFSGPRVLKGDSGGPLMVQASSHLPWFSIGLVSFGSPQQNTHSGFTKVDSYLEWIEKHLKPQAPLVANLLKPALINERIKNTKVPQKCYFYFYGGNSSLF